MNRNTYILIGILAVLIAVAYFLMQKPGERSSTGESGESLVKIDSLAIDKIEITSPTSKIALEKKGVEWFVQEPLLYRADQSNVASLIHKAKGLIIKSIVSNKTEKQSLFQVDSTGLLVRMYAQGSEKAAFILGKSGSGFSEMYARRAQSNDVALVGGASSYVFNRPVKEWRDRTILSVSQDKIKEVRFQYGDTTFVLAVKDSVWLVGKDSTQESTVNSLLSSLSNFQADNFIDTPSVKPPKITAQISYAGAQLNFAYQKAGEKYLVQGSNSPQWFEVQTWRANQVLKRKKDLLKSGK